MKVEHCLRTEGGEEIYYRVCKMMVQGKSNADYGREKAQKCIVLFVK